MKIGSILFISFFVLLATYSVFAQFHHWSQTYSKTIKGVSAAAVWDIWQDINHWHTWQEDIEYAKLNGEFEMGNSFILKPIDVSAVTISLIEVEKNKSFTDLTRFPLAKMYGKHEFIQHGDALEIKTTMSVEGFFAFIWRKIVAEDVAAGMQAQTESLIKKVQDG